MQSRVQNNTTAMLLLPLPAPLLLQLLQHRTW
jgi:hypothetical protein